MAESSECRRLGCWGAAAIVVAAISVASGTVVHEPNFSSENRTTCFGTELSVQCAAGEVVGGFIFVGQGNCSTNTGSCCYEDKDCHIDWVDVAGRPLKKSVVDCLWKNEQCTFFDKYPSCDTNGAAYLSAVNFTCVNESLVYTCDGDGEFEEPSHSGFIITPAYPKDMISTYNGCNRSWMFNTPVSVKLVIRRMKIEYDSYTGACNMTGNDHFNIIALDDAIGTMETYGPYCNKDPQNTQDITFVGTGFRVEYVRNTAKNSHIGFLVDYSVIPVNRSDPSPTVPGPATSTTNGESPVISDVTIRSTHTNTETTPVSTPTACSSGETSGANAVVISLSVLVAALAVSVIFLSACLFVQRKSDTASTLNLYRGNGKVV